jgi:predicted O-methyltransferase YrrM
VSYHGYVPHVKEFLSSLQHTPSVLEVGVDRGVTFISLAAHLSRSKKEYNLIGVDVLVQESTALTVSFLDRNPDEQRIYLLQGNSLVVLPSLVSQGFKFDVVLIDGDHNYYTVSKELESLNDLTYDHSVVLIDDYNGRWSERDLWYAEREDYSKIDVTTKPVETEKHGVKPAVDEFLQKNPQWRMSKPLNGEPVVLSKVIVADS